MSVLKSVSDTILRVFVPKVEASAHCVFCSFACVDGHYLRTCRNQCEDTIEVVDLGACVPPK
ncbi:hypothetical protein Afil01_01490 [Actinorhabdospora filicis]|uniref:Uncharacterized protein n=1 Tax=Actinorhabdospora filicis TaxID=1785913 RepID=A0A9W6SG16_9ACTN|nr:hypothetical protein [Actinorhabdospora filicis]GLZ75342.1 hypothetical protein Afil01_01490 [Actinorhabdospora filicis]